MSRHLTTFGPGESETDEVVKRWMDREGINKDLVSGYSIYRMQGELPKIMLECYFDDRPEPEENKE